MKKINLIKNKLKEIRGGLGSNNSLITDYKNNNLNLDYDVLYIGLFGSQNYNLDHDNSDIDVIAVVNMDVDDYLKGNRISKHYKTKYGEVTVKDILSFAHLVINGNPTYIEAINTMYYIGCEEFRDLFKETYISLRACLGAIGSYTSRLDGIELTLDSKSNLKIGINALRFKLTILEFLNSIENPEDRIKFYVFEDSDIIRTSLIRNNSKELNKNELDTSLVEEYIINSISNIDMVNLKELIYISPYVNPSQEMQDNVKTDVLNFVKKQIGLI